MNSHAAVPIADHLYDNVFRIYFSARDINNKSCTYSLDYDVVQNKIIEINNEPILTPGKTGTFDDAGAMASCIMTHNDIKYLYYIGWNISKSVPFRNAIGLAIKKPEGKFEKYSQGPIIDRSIHDPIFTASSCVLYHENKFKMWYLSCIEWDTSVEPIRHSYNIKYAESADAINWIRTGITAIDFKDDYEYAISTPRVIIEQGKYKMWYSYRASEKNTTYRIGYAESDDGINFTRLDELAGIDVSQEGWDSEMICYPYIFDHNNYRYMLYNGNSYGKTGFGLAKMTGAI
jgi:hypothetical protein